MRYAITTALVLFSIEPALAFDGQKWAQADHETREWFKGLHNPAGFPCCDYADGTRVDDPDYKENEDGTFEVNINGQWMHIDKDHLVTATNRIGYAVFWGHADRNMIYCFMPGARG